MAAPKHYPGTPDGRYFVVRGRLWRSSDPALAPDARQALVERLMGARRRVALARKAGDADAERAAHADVDEAKRGLGERGPVWWTDGAPDYNRHMAANTPYADWYAALPAEDRADVGRA
ncbi:hypothetical protein HH212_21335 [Massilia forsythiae]|uniref:Uncharacterized protein n=1 Tax=Massilia forsythiae TaxID=2728020 RepID=A0A7Z2W017_9BURK|nr:hypothetical protein [Massilia forsythiae]QJE02249.1 hypothetical protein HH212_21335 [Massilia forsythiae]